jgi:hypothetical protein
VYIGAGPRYDRKIRKIRYDAALLLSRHGRQSSKTESAMKSCGFRRAAHFSESTKAHSAIHYAAVEYDGS